MIWMVLLLLLLLFFVINSVDVESCASLPLTNYIPMIHKLPNADQGIRFRAGYVYLYL